MTTDYPVAMQLNVRIPMRGGGQLSADIYLPQTEGPFSTDVRHTFGNSVLVKMRLE